MNKNLFCISVLFGAALLGAARAQSMPESQVSSPVEETVQSGRSLDGTKNASWEQKRAERRVAREKLLSKLRESSPQEKVFIHEALSKKRNESSRNTGDFSKRGTPPRRMENERRQMNDNHRAMNSGRDVFAPPSPEYGDPKF